MARKYKYFLRGKGFTSKQKLTDALRVIREASCPEGQDFGRPVPKRSPESKMLFAYLKKYHPNGEQILSECVGVKSIYAARNPEEKRGICFFVEHRTGKTNFGITKVGQPSPMAQLTQAARKATRGSQEAFKKKFFAANPEPICPVTGEPMVFAEAHVDHVSPQFKEILDGFLKQEGIDKEDPLKNIELERTGSGKNLPEPLLTRFREFHDSRAMLQVVSKNGHRSLTSERRMNLPF